ncbi:MAG TPA: S8 family serine peptidase [Bryobacteraceae bacterium]|nr:S8 family serine peptidase [Bryobacteraceae bacterium]
MVALEITKLMALMERTSGSPDVKIGLIDGPVMTRHPDLSRERLHEVPGHHGGACTRANSAACLHGTFVAGILSARRGSSAPAICPGCTLLIRSLFIEGAAGGDRMPSATPRELAAAIVDCIDAGAQVINLSLALTRSSSTGERSLEEAVDRATRRGVIVVAAAGNQSTIGSSALTRHPWVIPVAACDLRGRPLSDSNFGGSIGRRGLTAPGAAITSLRAEGQTVTLGGTSVAAPFVTGTIALLWSEFPAAPAARIMLAVTGRSGPRRASVVPPLLDAEAAYQSLLRRNARR